MARSDPQVCSKRSDRLKELGDILSWPDNLSVGVTVESNEYLYRIYDLVKIPAKTRFLSLEPLLSRMENLPLNGIHGVIVGGESGPGAREMEKKWVREIRDQCVNEKVPFFFKQWGGVQKSKNGRILDGRIWDDLPEAYENTRAKPFDQTFIDLDN